MSHEAPVLPEIDPTKPPPPEYLPKYDQFITEDDAPVDNFFSEKQQRLLTEPIYSADVQTMLERPVLAAANVGLFFGEHQPAIVPDVLLSLDVQLAEDLWPKENRSYFIWRQEKPPDAVIEIVSNTVGGEADRKRARYASLGVGYYIVFDPREYLRQGVLRVYELHARTYVDLERPMLPDAKLGVTLWQGSYEGHPDTWLRWTDAQGVLIPTGAELARIERERAEQERQRAERLAARLRALGIDPDAEV